MKMKRKYILIALSSIIVIVLVFLLLNREEEYRELKRDYAEIEKSGVLRIVVDYNSVGYFVSGDTIAGFNNDLIQLLQTYTPVNIDVFLEASLDKAIEDLNAEKYDVLARSTPVTSELRDDVSFTEPIVQNKQVLIQRKKKYNEGKEPIRSHLDLATKTTYVPQNSPAILRIKNLSHEIGDTIYIHEDDTYGAEQLAMMVASKESDFAVCDELVARQLSTSLVEIDYETLIEFTPFEAWAVRKNSPVLLDSLNVWINRAQATQSYSRIYRKYYK